MSVELPEPLVPADVDLRSYKYIPLEFRRLFSSDTWVLGSPEEKVACMHLWCESWHQVPTGSVPADDRMLAHLSKSGPRWKRLRNHALRGWIHCSDDRYYHPVVCEKALEVWGGKRHKTGVSAARAEAGRRGAAAKLLRSQRIAEAKAKGTHVEEEWLALIEVCGGRCVKCGADQVTKDHIQIIARGGSDAIDNLQPLCRACNSAKGLEPVDYRPKDWRERLAKFLLDHGLAIASDLLGDSLLFDSSSHPQVFKLPDWIDARAWAGFVEMRRLIKKPMTERAQEMIVAKLGAISGNAGQLAGQILDQSTRNNWQDVYVLKADQARIGGGGTALEERNRAVADRVAKGGGT